MLRPLIVKTLIANFGITFVGFINSILLSRSLGAFGRGEVAAALLWPTLLVYISSMGLISASLYFSARPDSRPERLFANGLLLGVLLGSLAATVGYFSLPWLLKSQPAEVINASRVFLVVVPISLVLQIGGGILQGRMRITAYNSLRAVLPTGYLIGTIILIVIGRLTLLNIIYLHLFLNVVVFVGTIVCLVSAGVKINLRTDVQLAGEMMKYGGKVHVGNVSGLANLSLDQVLMASLLPPVALGLYVVAVSAANISQVFSQAVQTVSMPTITQRESATERASVLQAVFRRYWLISIIISAGIALLLPVAIPAIFGSGFKEALVPAEILIVGALFLGAQGVLSGGAQSLGSPWLGSASQLWGLIVTVVLLYVLLPLIGITGAAIASTAAYGTQLAVVVFGLRRTHQISPMDLFKFRFRDFMDLDIAGFIRAQRTRLLSDQS
jgi:O-antigen/teichoic acid export membrane protein